MASAVLAGAIIWRMVQQKLLVAPFQAFALMLGVVLARDGLMSIPRYDSHAYTVAWGWSLPVLLAAQIWAGSETLKAVARLYPKIGRFAVRLFVVCLAMTAVVCCLALPLELHRMKGEEVILRSLFLLQRWVDSSIAGTLVLVALFFARFPAPLKQPPRNLVIHTVLLSAYFCSYAVLFFAENLAPLGTIASLERLQFALVVLLYAAWALCLSRRGEMSQPWPEVDVMVLKSMAQGR
jgi:hypothetical protein